MKGGNSRRWIAAGHVFVKVTSFSSLDRDRGGHAFKPRIRIRGGASSTPQRDATATSGRASALQDPERAPRQVGTVENRLSLWMGVCVRISGNTDMTVAGTVLFQGPRAHVGRGHASRTGVIRSEKISVVGNVGPGPGPSTAMGAAGPTPTSSDGEHGRGCSIPVTWASTLSCLIEAQQEPAGS